jgi:hypothetical protein
MAKREVREVEGLAGADADLRELQSEIEKLLLTSSLVSLGKSMSVF